jgi:hypothetical protein
MAGVATAAAKAMNRRKFRSAALPVLPLNSRTALQHDGLSDEIPILGRARARDGSARLLQTHATSDGLEAQPSFRLLRMSE